MIAAKSLIGSTEYPPHGRLLAQSHDGLSAAAGV